jgi:four helix bundle protein
LLRDLREAFIHNPAMKDFRNLKVWEKAHHLTLALYKVTGSFPRDEAYGLASQIRRASSSIPSNIAEGCGREGDPELARFCIIARGSASELEYQLLLARDLKLIPLQVYANLSEQTVEIKRMLTVLVQKLTADR